MRPQTASAAFLMPKKLNPDCMYILIQGPAGVGKTTMMSLIQEQLDAHDIQHEIMQVEPPVIEIQARPLLDPKAFRWVPIEK